MNSNYARRSSRPTVRMTLHFRCSEVEGEGQEYTAETLNVSTHGFLMKSAQRLSIGNFLFLKLRVPTGISGSPFSQIRGTGRVVHEQQLEDGTVGYGIEIRHTVPRARRSL